MKIHSLFFGVLAAGCLVLPRHASAQVSVDEFNAWKETVNKLGQQVQELMKTHDQDQKTHDQDQKTHEEDQKKIESLQQQLDRKSTRLNSSHLVISYAVF